MKIATAKEVAHFLKLTESTVYSLTAEGKLPGFRIGNSWRFDMDEILQQIREAREEKTQNRTGTPTAKGHKK
jgi:excisionase family DNA binding protein